MTNGRLMGLAGLSVRIGAATIEVAPKGLRRGKRVTFAGNGFSGGIR